MSSFDQIIKILQAQQKLPRLIQGGNWIPKLLYDQNLANHNYRGLNSISFILKGMAKKPNFYRKQNSIDVMLKQLVLPQLSDKFQNQFTRIYSQQQVLEKGLKGITGLLHQQFQVKQLFASEHLFRIYSDRAVTLAALEDDSKEIEIIEEINTRTAQIVTDIEERTYVTPKDLQRFQTTILELIETHVEEKLKEKKHTIIRAKNWELLKNQLISFIFSLTFWLIPSPTSKQLITKEKLKQNQHEILKNIDSILSKGKLFRTVNKNFRLRQLPQFSSTKIFLLKKGIKVQVLTSNNTWVHTTITGKDGYPVNGWLPKVYLSK